MKAYLLIPGLLLACLTCFARGSSEMIPLTKLLPQVHHSYVDTDDCTAPIRSAPYVILAGKGVANMELSCPKHHPVMYGWQQRMGYAGLMAVQVGGGASWITCCTISHKWVPVVAS